MVGTLEPVDGMVKRHNHLRIGQYHQHLTELLPMDMSPLEYMVGHSTATMLLLNTHHQQVLRMGTEHFCTCIDISSQNATEV
jgi:hypothetical protein